MHGYTHQEAHALRCRMPQLQQVVLTAVCMGGAAVDACTEACQRAVCTNTHQVPAWNDACLKRCTSECTRGRTF